MGCGSSSLVDEVPTAVTTSSSFPTLNASSEIGEFRVALHDSNQFGSDEGVLSDEPPVAEVDRPASPLSFADYSFHSRSLETNIRSVGRLDHLHLLQHHNATRGPGCVGTQECGSLDSPYLLITAPPNEWRINECFVNEGRQRDEVHLSDYGSMQAVIGSEYTSRRGDGDHSNDPSLVSETSCRRPSVDSFSNDGDASCPLEMRLCTFIDSIDTKDFSKAKCA